MKKLSITSEDLSSFCVEVEGSTVEILFLYMELCKQLINNKIATPELLKGIVNLTNYTDELSSFNVSEKRLKEIAKLIMEGNKENE